MHQGDRDAEVVGRGRREVAQEPEHGRGLLAGPEQRSAEDDRPDGVQAVLEGRRDAEVPTATAQSPEELRIALGVDAHALGVRGHELDGKQVVDREPVAAHPPL